MEWTSFLNRLSFFDQFRCHRRSLGCHQRMLSQIIGIIARDIKEVKCTIYIFKVEKVLAEELTWAPSRLKHDVNLL